MLQALQPDLVTGATLLHSAIAYDISTFQATGATHVMQHVFECHTCGMVESYCLSVGCSRVCHRGHDVRCVLNDIWARTCRNLVPRAYHHSGSLARMEDYPEPQCAAAAIG